MKTCRPLNELLDQHIKSLNYGLGEFRVIDVIWQNMQWDFLLEFLFEYLRKNPRGLGIIEGPPRAIKSRESSLRDQDDQRTAGRIAPLCQYGSHFFYFMMFCAYRSDRFIVTVILSIGKAFLSQVERSAS